SRSSRIIGHHLNNAATAAVAFDLPLLDRCVLTSECGLAWQPEDTRTEVCLGSSMVKKDRSLATNVSHFEAIFHHKKHLHIVRRCDVRHERAEDHKPSQVARG